MRILHLLCIDLVCSGVTFSGFDVVDVQGVNNEVDTINITLSSNTANPHQ